MYQISQLKNKLKVVTHHMPHVHGVTSGIFVATGSRYEPSRLAGISHFIEHMLFKGTQRRPTPVDISSSIEGIGGYLNAATSQDYTLFFNRVPFRHTQVALDVLGDMINDSLFERTAVEQERGVILEEFNMYIDTPTRYIYDLIMTAVWPRNPLGRDVIGTKKTLQKISRHDFLDYMQGYYQPQNMVLSLAGKVNHSQVVKLAEKYFGQNKNSRLLNFNRVKFAQKSPQVLIYPKTTDQTHLAIAVSALGRDHSQESSLSVLDVILGTGMSSRLFQNIRVKRGLCYSISSFSEKFTETGIFGAIAGLNTSKIDLAIQAILAELKDLTLRPVLKSELDQAKEYLRGSLTLQMDNSDDMSLWYGFQALFYKRIKSPEQKIKELLKVSEDDIMKLAKKLFSPKRLNLALIGPFKPKDKHKFLKLLNNY
jgi:predicted Zn-dependent peptidase